MNFNIGEPRFKALRLVQYWQVINSLVLILLLVKDWNWWFLLLFIPIIFVLKKLSGIDSEKVIYEESKFIYDRHPMKDDIEEILREIKDLKQKSDLFGNFKQDRRSVAVTEGVHLKEVELYGSFAN